MVVQRLVFAVLFAAVFVFRESSSERCSSEGDDQNAIFCWGDKECCEHNTKCCEKKKKSDDSVSSSHGSNRHVFVGGLFYGGSNYGSAGSNSRLNVPSYQNKFNVPKYNFDFPKFPPPKVPEFKFDPPKSRSTGGGKIKLKAVLGAMGAGLAALIKWLTCGRYCNKKKSTSDEDLLEEVQVVESNTNGDRIENEDPHTNRINHIVETRTDPRFIAIPLPPPPPGYDVATRMPAPNASTDVESDRPPPYDTVAAHGNHEENILVTRI